MATTEASPPAVTICLTEEERTELVSFLEQLHRDKQIEVHRTDALDYRRLVEHQVALLQRLLSKLGPGPKEVRTPDAKLA